MPASADSISQVNLHILPLAFIGAPAHTIRQAVISQIVGAIAVNGPWSILICSVMISLRVSKVLPWNGIML